MPWVNSLDFAGRFVNFVKQAGSGVFPVAVVGTPGTTEFQSSMEAAMFDGAFEEARYRGNFGADALEIYGLGGKGAASLLFCMGISFELATMRQKFKNEADFPVIALGLATDAVGGLESRGIDHDKVVAKAIEKGEEHRDLLLRYVDELVDSKALACDEGEDFSIRAKLAE